MPDLLHEIQKHLNSPQIRENLTPLFCETLRWGGPKGHPRALAVGAPLSRTLTATPVAHLGGLPVFRVEWDSDKLPNLTQRRAVHRALAPTHLEHLLCYVTKDSRQAAFVWARKRGESKLELRTLPYEVGWPARTTLERLGELAFTLDDLGLLGEPTPSLLTDRLNQAFDVQRVTDDFFKNYERCFHDEVKPAVKRTLGGDAEAAHQFTQLLFNRLMFCWFLQKKGWLGGRRDYLVHLLQRACRLKAGDEGHTEFTNFYHDYLSFLFFEVLSNPEEKRRKHYPTDPDVSREAPFLNGGLFERQELDERVESAPRLRCLPNIMFRAVLDDLFARYNFTVEESTPLDVQVALDPELLGTIFEKLVTGRHETGSYYTPKPVVEFMCREALARYIAQASRLPQAIVEYLIYDHKVEKLSPGDATDIIRSLDTIKVCDPACGSGAYLVAMLHELVSIYRALYTEKLNDPQKDYDLKLRIIERNLYGVDLDPFAVNIARLRLWLTLIVDSEETDWRKVRPLPNLDFKIEIGDSLTAPDPSKSAKQLSFRREQVDKFYALKSDFMRTYGAQKKTLYDQIERARLEVARWTRSADIEGGFMWDVEFAEVFAEGGFDVIVANPPYVRADAPFKHLADNDQARQEAIAEWKDYRAGVLDSGVYQTLYEKWDLYLPFLERAYQVLRPNGRMVFIISDAYNAAKYARKSHEFFLKNTRVERVDFCTEIPLFEAGVNNTIIHFAKAKPDPGHQPLRVRRWGETRDDFDRNAQVLTTLLQAQFGRALFKPDGAEPPPEQVGLVPLGRICYISYGLRANADDRYWQGEFTTEDCVSSTKDAAHPKPFVQGKDLVKWWPRQVWHLEWGTRRAPKKFSRATFSALHEARHKVLGMKNMGDTPKCFYDDGQTFFDSTVVGFVPWHLLKGVVNRSISKTAKYRRQEPSGDREDRESTSRQFDSKYLLAVMNSAFAREWLSKRRRHKISTYPDDWKPLPIAPIPTERQVEFVNLVDAILAEFKRQGYPLPSDAARRVAELEREIDERVAKLYRA